MPKKIEVLAREVRLTGVNDQELATGQGSRRGLMVRDRRVRTGGHYGLEGSIFGSEFTE